MKKDENRNTIEIKINPEELAKMEAEAESRPATTPWTPLEDLKVIKFYRKLGPSRLRKYLKGRTVQAIRKRADVLNVVRRRDAQDD